jgi:hypothetical protein
MSTLYFILLILFAAYITAIMIMFRVPNSISDSFYHPKIGYAFTLWCDLIGLGVCGLIVELSAGQWYQFLCLFAGGGLLLVGAAPRFKTHERTIHYAGAGTCALAALGWICLTGYGYIPIPLVLLAGGLAWCFGRKKIVFWTELALFASMFTTLGIKILGG